MISVQSIVQRIGEMPIGDPVAMRSHASRLDAEAELIEARARGVTASVNDARYQSPAADRLRNGAGNVERELLAAANRLRVLAGDLRASAARVAAEQHWWHTEFTRVEQELARALHGH
jgi:hypothetical protein